MPNFVVPSFSRLALSAGTFAALGLSAGMAQACPDWSQVGQQLSFQGGAPASFPVVAGGENDLAGCPMPGNGYVATRPDFDLDFQNANGGALQISIDAQCDSVLLVNDAAGNWHFNDDDSENQTLNSRVVIPNAPSGAYDIWVGTYGPSTCQSNMTLSMAGGDGGAVAPVAGGGRCPNPALNGQMLAYDGATAMESLRTEVIAGGDIDASTCPETSGHGYVIEAPDFTLSLASNPGMGDLNLRVESQCDPVMIVHDSMGRWHFSDDAEDLNPALMIPSAEPGEYDIWVGTYGQQTCPAALVVEGANMMAAGGQGDGKPGDAPVQGAPGESEPEPLDEGK